MAWSAFALWRVNKHRLQYQTIDGLYTDKEKVTWYWRLIAQTATYMVLGGFLILPTTFNNDPNLRFNKGVLAIIIVALLTGGYSLTALVWFACPSVLFRLDSIFIPVFSVSLFAFCAACYALASSSRYVWSNPAAPTTLALTVASAFVYGILSLITYRGVKRMKRQQTESYGHNRNASGTPTWNEPGYNANFIRNMHPGALSPQPYDPQPSRSPASFDGGSMMTLRQPSEEELVNQQMAKLLTRPNMSASPNASQTTFHLDWQYGEGEVELDSNGRRRQPTFDESRLAPGRARRQRSQSANAGSWGRIRGRAGDATGGASRQRTASRDDRRRDIEMDSLRVS